MNVVIEQEGIFAINVAVGSFVYLKQTGPDGNEAMLLLEPGAARCLAEYLLAAVPVGLPSSQPA